MRRNLLLLIGLALAGWWSIAVSTAAAQERPEPGMLPLPPAIGTPFQPAAARLGTAVLGEPISPVVRDPQTSRLVQYFEHGRLEILSDGTVRRTPLGTLAVIERPAPVDTAPALTGDLAAFWYAHGGAAVFGVPVSLPQTLLVRGTPVVGQYFTYARLERHWTATGSVVVVGDLAREHARRVVPPDLLTPQNDLPVPVVLATATVAGSVGDGAAVNGAQAVAALDGTVIAPGAVFSFLATIGPMRPDTGYVGGPAIINGQVGSVWGGGVCLVATAVYRAARTAGLPIVERHTHTLPLAAFADRPGWDAAVYAPTQDLRFQNARSVPVQIQADVAADGRIRVTLVGSGSAGRGVADALVPQAPAVAPATRPALAGHPAPTKPHRPGGTR